MKKFTVFMIFAILIFSTAVGCSRQVIKGSGTKNETQFSMEYSALNDTKTHEMKL